MVYKPINSGTQSLTKTNIKIVGCTLTMMILYHNTYTFRNTRSPVVDEERTRPDHYSTQYLHL